MKKTILYVDPFESEARRLLAALQDLEPEWEFIYAPASLPALASLRDNAIDAVIADTDLPDASGVKLLDQVMTARPRAVRFVLSAMKDTNVLLRCLGTAHQYLVKPCDPQSLRAALRRAFALELWLPGEKVVKLLTTSPQIPSPPRLYFNAVRVLRSETTTLEEVGAIISQDPAMTAKILQAVNSPLFGLGRSVVNPSEAVFHLGARTTLSLMLVAHTYSYFDTGKNAGLNMEELWRHSLAVGKFAAKIAAEEDCPLPAREEAATAGMLHDIGKLVLAANHSASYRQAAELTKTGKEWWEAEQEVFGVNHAEVGACLAVLWGLTASVVEAIALHHHPVLMISDQFSPLAAVHAADAIDHAARRGLERVEADAGFLERLGVLDHLEDWRRVCREMVSAAPQLL